MPIFVSTTFAAQGSKITDVVSLMVRHGLKRIELGSIHCYEEKAVYRLVEIGAEYLVHNYFPPPSEPFVVNLASLDDRIRARSIEHALACVTAAKKLGARLYTFHPGFLSDPISSRGSPTNYDFQFGDKGVGATIYEQAWERLIDAARIIARYARAQQVPIAVESEGSVSKASYLLLQKPEEFDRFFAAIPDSIVGVTLNLGHLNLAANVFGFDRLAFINRIAHRVSAIEISHNEGIEDEHRSLLPGAWYWRVVRDARFANVPIVLECRDASIETVCQSVRLLEGEYPDASAVQ